MKKKYKEVYIKLGTITVMIDGQEVEKPSVAYLLGDEVEVDFRRILNMGDRKSEDNQGQIIVTSPDAIGQADVVSLCFTDRTILHIHANFDEVREEYENYRRNQI